MLMISTLKNVVLLLNTDRAIKPCWARWSWAEWEGRDGSETPLLTAAGGCYWQGIVVELAEQVVVCSLWYLRVFEVALGTSDQN